jgi:hypothetical protein
MPVLGAGDVQRGSLEALPDWLAARGGAPGALFCPVSQTGEVTVRRMTGQAVYARFRRRARRAGVAVQPARRPPHLDRQPARPWRRQRHRAGHGRARIRHNYRSCDLGILVDEPAEAITPHHPRNGRWSGRNGRGKGRCLAQRTMRSMLVVVDDVGRQHPLELARPHDRSRSWTSRPTVPTQRWANALARGACTGISKIRTPSAAKAASKAR